MLCCSVHYETRSALSPTQSSADFCSICFEDVETVLPDRHVIEPSSSEAHRGRIIDRSHSEATTSASSPSIQDGLTLRLPSGAWA